MKRFYDKMIRLAYIYRYSNIPRIKNESVAEHSFLVATIVLKLFDEYDFNLERSLLAAICHDMPEYIINDTTHETKELFPDLAEALKNAEKEATKTLPGAVQIGISIFNNSKKPEGLIVQLADIIQCSQYAENEVKLGNNGYMDNIVTESRKRQYELREKLKEYLR